MSLYLLFFLLFLLQFFYFPVGMSFFEGAKVYAVEVFIFGFLVLTLFSKEGFKLNSINKSFLWSAGILLVIAMYHVVFHNTQTLLFGNQFRLQGTLLLFSLLLFAILSSKISIERFVKIPILVLIIIAQLVCTLLFIGVGTDRPVGTLGEPNALAACMIFLWPFILFAWPKKLPLRVIAGIGLLFAFITIFVSGSRSGLIALGIQFGFLLIKWILEPHVKGKERSKQVLKYAVIISCIVLVLSYITPFFGPRTEYEDRGEIWKSAAYAGLANPILGVGFGNAEYEYHRANVTLHNKLTGYYVDNAHNIFLDWFVQAGIVGLGVLLFLLYQSFKSFINKGQIRDIVLLLGLITALSFNPASVVSLIALWWLLGQGTSNV
jgi:O-antigen ligase